MDNRPDPRSLAEISYYLGIASVVIVIVAILINLTPVAALQPLGNVIWLAVITSAVGIFLAAAARSDFKRNPPGEMHERRARTGLRVNLLALILMLLLMLFLLLLALMPRLLPMMVG